MCKLWLKFIHYQLFSIILAACSSCLVLRSCPRFNRLFSRSLKHFNLMWKFVFNALVVFRIWSFHFQASSCFQDKLVPFCQRLHTRSKKIKSQSVFSNNIRLHQSLLYLTEWSPHQNIHHNFHTCKNTRKRRGGGRARERKEGRKPGPGRASEIETKRDERDRSREGVRGKGIYAELTEINNRNKAQLLHDVI